MTRLATARMRLRAVGFGPVGAMCSTGESVDMSRSPFFAFVFAVWIGLVTGALEAVLLFVRRQLFDPTLVTALELNPHARWMIPMSYGIIFGVCGAVLAAVAFFTRSRRLVGVAMYGLCYLASVSVLQVTSCLTTIASSSLAGGITLWLAPFLMERAGRPNRLFGFSLAALIGFVGICAGLDVGREKFSERWLPGAAPGAPNVVLIVLDTVRAQSLSVYGYGRDTSPHLEEFASRGVRFDQARTAGAWILPAHASMFTGHWPYELSARRDRPLDTRYPTLAGFLRSHGYATAGFAANTYFGSRWYGLGRGFTHYEDVPLTSLEILRSSIMGRYLLRKASPFHNSRPNAYFERKDAEMINREAIAWLSNRPVGRPFFAFLNYDDAHDPYLCPRRPERPFGRTPADPRDLATLRDWLEVVKRKPGRRDIALARDGYDDCIAYLDDQVGRLFAKLEAKGLLENTLVIVAGDHGELIGERGEFGHGQSLHHEVIHVPLLMVAPRRVPRGRIVATPVSLRDLPATVADLVGLGRESPFPGHSLAQHWSSTPATAVGDGTLILTETADELSTAPTGAITGRSLVAGSTLYIRKKDGSEELYDLAVDPAELHDMGGDPQARPILLRFRDAMHRIDIEAEDLERQRRANHKAESE